VAKLRGAEAADLGLVAELNHQLVIVAAQLATAFATPP
jgi:hypothetical protein